jgi:hypothetical protein
LSLSPSSLLPHAAVAKRTNALAAAREAILVRLVLTICPTSRGALRVTGVTLYVVGHNITG